MTYIVFSLHAKKKETYLLSHSSTGLKRLFLARNIGLPGVQRTSATIPTQGRKGRNEGDFLALRPFSLE